MAPACFHGAAGADGQWAAPLWASSSAFLSAGSGVSPPVPGDGLFVGLGIVELNETLYAFQIPAWRVSVGVFHLPLLLTRLL